MALALTAMVIGLAYAFSLEILVFKLSSSSCTDSINTFPVSLLVLGRVSKYCPELFGLLNSGVILDSSYSDTWILTDDYPSTVRTTMGICDYHCFHKCKVRLNISYQQ